VRRGGGWGGGAVRSSLRAWALIQRSTLEHLGSRHNWVDLIAHRDQVGWHGTGPVRSHRAGLVVACRVDDHVIGRKVAQGDSPAEFVDNYRSTAPASSCSRLNRCQAASDPRRRLPDR